MTEPTFARLLAEAMERAGLTQWGLAARSGCDRSFISRTLSGERHPSAGMVKQLADGLGLPPGDPIRSAMLTVCGYADERGPRPMGHPLAYDLDDALRCADPATRDWLEDCARNMLAGYRARIGRARVIALRGTERREETA
jgi:transcriptional regulator with XRE-family HTH domain